MTVSQAFADAQTINLEALVRYPLPVLRRALGLAKGLEKRALSGGYEQVRQVLEEAVAKAEAPYTR